MLLERLLMLPKRIQSTMTVFNIVINELAVPVIQASILEGVFWTSSYGVNISMQNRRESAVMTDDKVLVIIPMAEDRKFSESHTFLKLAATERKKYWTLTKGDRIVNQAVTEIFERIADIEKTFGPNNVFTITNVADNRFGAKRQHHFAVSGK